MLIINSHPNAFIKVIVALNTEPGRVVVLVLINISRITILSRRCWVNLSHSVRYINYEFHSQILSAVLLELTAGNAA